MIQSHYNEMEKHFETDRITWQNFQNWYLKWVSDSINELRKVKKFLYIDDEDNHVLISWINKELFYEELYEYDKEIWETFENYYTNFEEKLLDTYPNIRIEMLERI